MTTQAYVDDHRSRLLADAERSSLRRRRRRNHTGHRFLFLTRPVRPVRPADAQPMLSPATQH